MRFMTLELLTETGCTNAAVSVPKNRVVLVLFAKCAGFVGLPFLLPCLFVCIPCNTIHCNIRGTRDNRFVGASKGWFVDVADSTEPLQILIARRSLVRIHSDHVHQWININISVCNRLLASVAKNSDIMFNVAMATGTLSPPLNF